MRIIDIIKNALDSIKVNTLRVFLTLLGIGIGVFAIIGAGALVASLKSAFLQEKANLGENTFAIKRMPEITFGRSWHKYRKRKPITYSTFKEFEKRMTKTTFISAESSSNLHTVKYENLSTDSDVTLVGTDHNYFINNNTAIEYGRGFSAEDISLNRNVAIIGADVVVKIFPNEDPIGKEIRIKNQRFRVVGVLESRGALLGNSLDNQVIIPITQFLKYYASFWEESLTISVRAYSQDMLIPTYDEAVGILRALRKVEPWEENSFEVATNASITQQFGKLSLALNFFGSFSGAVALLVAGVGIMNIMLVSVKERTKEIGIRKAVGAKKPWILSQFLLEAVLLCQLGAVFGILFGFVAARLVGNAIDMNIVFPAGSVILSIVFCTLIGIFFGMYPAWKASNLDPIDALRYE